MAPPPPTVLIIEDNAVFLGILTAFFERSLSHLQLVGSARTAEEGLHLASTLRPAAVTVDLVLPGRSGLETIKGLRDLLPQTAIVVLTQYDDPSFRAAALAAGADGFVSKADLHNKLLPAIEGATHARHPDQKDSV